MTFLSNRLTKIRNGIAAQSEYVVCPLQSGNTPANAFHILSILQKNGIIRGFSYKESRVSKKMMPQYYIYLKYDATGVSVIDTVFLVSKPSRRIYVSAASLWQPQSSVGFFVLSTTQGILTNAQARYLNVGGEVLFGIT